jgi:Ca2+-binding EF-hand superfamily protein
MGHYATSADISEAFQLLDTDNSETIDINELAVFMPAIVPDSNRYTCFFVISKKLTPTMTID